MGFYSLSAAEESCRKHSRAVEDEQVAFSQKAREVAESTVEPLSSVPIEVKHTGGGAVWEGFLGNTVRRKVEVEIGNEHVRALYGPRIGDPRDGSSKTLNR